jgi:transposase-like protein
MTEISYSGYRFPPEIIQQAIWLYVRFTLSFRDVEDLLAERGIVVSYETVRRWVNHFGPKIAADLRRRRPIIFRHAHDTDSACANAQRSRQCLVRNAHRAAAFT